MIGGAGVVLCITKSGEVLYRVTKNKLNYDHENYLRKFTVANSRETSLIWLGFNHYPNFRGDPAAQSIDGYITLEARLFRYE